MFVYLFVCLSIDSDSGGGAWVYVCHMHSGAYGGWKRVSYLLPWNWITDGCEVQSRCWEPNPHPLQEQQMLLATEPSFQPQSFFLANLRLYLWMTVISRSKAPVRWHGHVRGRLKPYCHLEGMVPFLQKAGMLLESWMRSSEYERAFLVNQLFN